MSGIRIRPVLTPPVRPEKTPGTAAANASPHAATSAAAGSFEELLSEAVGGNAADTGSTGNIGSAGSSTGIRFSRHAQERLSARGIELGGQDLARLGGAVEEASRKGVRDSLVMMGSLAFIVSVPDKTVVTAMPVSEAGTTIFTNIDGAVIA